MNKIFCLMALLGFVAVTRFVFAQNGRYDAFVSTDSGTYKAVVEVEDGLVVYVCRENGDHMNLQGAKIVDSQADGTTSSGEQVHVAISGYNDYYGDVGRSSVSPGTVVEEGTGQFNGGATSDLP
ncbi:MAG: hypothetical protein V1869_05355 [Candidatus Omnitrophota bacterium]